MSKFLNIISVLAISLLCACSKAPDTDTSDANVSAQESALSSSVTDDPESNGSESGDSDSIATGNAGESKNDAYSGEVHLVEIKLIDAQDDERGYCVDLFDHLTDAQPIAGLQAHNCFMYFGNGPTEDQGFDLNFFQHTGQLKLVHFDICMEVHNPNPRSPGSFVAAEPCTASPVQTFVHSEAGTISPVANSDICLTIGATTVPGGPRVVPPGLDLKFPPENNEGMHTIRRLTFEACSAAKSPLQQWEFRSGEYVPDTSAEKNRFL